ncbi:hypothetical protein PP505_gp62 [Gordonia phage Dorito]|uniref:Helix-turn-helix DNA binding domain protein n=2 Tax=Caudoviricetes TaxID=2731619 RepID=A0A0U4IRC6_9CAUD|nr:hypothetical protein PP505_gp62 [Gordonia phage Dorito]YP_010654930.1 hypothetical protein PP513_gp69 [Gordonia phage Howe]AZF93254.1 hypothetical protein SEA_ADORA_66 [Gordonia phage Adora]QDF16849.1 hypothetical protein SEA_TWINKLE_68 [Gordonia phage Twinkle]QYC54468.1 hypothetical protein SEA_SHLIM410_67 [Gordonia phage Shlim410]UAJ16318.1 hypothetical protein SEA_HORTENSE_69 [Gordonia phage Hortense]ALY07703.1 hypothetical protein PBI_HOWE_69 [Gordonia phage Howe]
MKDKRLYAKFTLDFADSHKVMPLSDKAFRCLVEATLWSRKQMTDGLLPSRYAVARWSLEVLQELASNDPLKPSLEEVEEGWMIRDFAEHQETKADIEARRERNKEAGRKGGLAKSKRSAKRGAKHSASEVVSENVAETETYITTSRSNSNEEEPNRIDVHQLVSELAKACRERGVKVPDSLDGWTTDARRLLDIDHRPLAEALDVLRWSQTDPFWSTNILSMGKFRKQYDQLRLKAGVKPTADPEELVREMWRSGSVGKLTELTGMTPDIIRWPDTEPEGFDRDKHRIEQRRKWIEDHRDEIVQRLRGAM